MIEVWFDGACEPVNPGGTGAFGFVVKRGEKLLTAASAVVGSGNGMTNNVAEYRGLIAALNWLVDNNVNHEHITARGDSKLVIEQVSGRWRINSGAYVPFAHQAIALRAKFPNLKLQWVPRDMNAEADELSKRELLARGITITQRR